jgi:hypothetical protein
MSLDIQNETNDRLRIALWLLVGIVLAASASAMLYYKSQQKGGITLTPPYSYTVNQSLNNTVEYVDSDYYPNGPESNNTAYVTDLTRAFTTDFYYSYEATKDLELTYTYDAVASVSGTYGIAGSSEDISSVWGKQFSLLRPTTKEVSGKGFTIAESIEVPFKQYKEIMDEFRIGLALPINSVMELKLTVKVLGAVQGETFTDTRTSTVSVPLNVQIYQLATRYDKTDTKQVPESPVVEGDRWLPQYEYIAVGVLVLAAALSIFMATRRGEYKSAYQRELEKIYRYHDGIIIRTSKPAKLSANKSVVPVSSFSDILNLEEETKAPIIASPAGDSATHFMVVDDDIVYVYVLGREPADLVAGDETEEVEEVLTQPKARSYKKRPLGHASKKRIQ